MKKVQIGNTNYEINIKYAEKGESLQRLMELLVFRKVQKEQEMNRIFVENGDR